MPNYQSSKIYCIRSPSTDKIYIGSTTQKLCARFGSHLRNYREYKDGKEHYITSFDIIKFNDSYIELLEDYPCNNREELNKKEGELIRSNTNCVNKAIAGRRNKEYYEDNKYKILEQAKQYRANNDALIKSRRRDLYQQNKDDVLKKVKKYREANRMAINEKAKIKDKIYRNNNKQKIKERKQKYYQKNKERISETHRLYRQKRKLEASLQASEHQNDNV